MQLHGSAIIITGGSGGLGSATARELARRGARVVLAARRPEPLARVAAELGASAIACPTDVRERAQIDRLVQTTLESFGRLDGLVNAHGVSRGARVLTDPDADLQEMVETNLLALARTAQAVVPTLKARGGGVIVNIGSVAGEFGSLGLYSATKFGVRGLSDALRRELRREHIAVVLIEPGFIRTPMTEGLRVPMPGPEVVGRAIANAIERPRARVIVPWPYVPLVYLSKVPGLADLTMGRLRVGSRRRSAPPRQ